ncbi:MAG TPA: hypothetical protein VEY89_13140 [Candidatus Dormibacteraeota bacterium]|nr:hypothetical protein [Candidatus Dormibacteraeota bacterium]
MNRSRQLLCACASLTLIATLAAASARADDDGGCHLAGGIKHVLELQFDNVHLRRDNPNVPSDLEQMPNLLNFLRSQGTVLTNHHTPLISHTADDIITTLTGNYGAKHGQPVSNSYGFFRSDGSVGFSSSFVYWTNTAPDGTPQMIDPRGKTHPAPWVPFTRAGCDVGAFSMANIEFENISGDIINVFGVNSPEAAEAAATPTLAVADFEGIAIHCARHSRVCGSAGKPDVLADEPQGYFGFAALYGNKNVAPRITGGQAAVKDLDGNPVADSHGNPGFPGFDPSASQALGYAATMLEAGVPVVYAYIADAHDNHFTGSGSYGPGEVGYVEQLAAYNASFGKFFARLKADGITPQNTLFVVTADENDHFAGAPGAPAGCDGINTPCTYVRLPEGCDGDFVACTTTNLGEVGVDVRQLLLTEFNDTTAFAVHSDDAPTVYLNGNPGPTDPATRAVEHNIGKLLAFDPIRNDNVPLMKRLADPAEMGFLHMVTQDPARTPTFTLFGNDDFFITAGRSPATCSPLASCSNEQPGFNWNHGDFQQDITHTWLALVGPHVRRAGETGAVFSDHTDTRPTLMHLTGLKDDYAHDGRVLVEILDDATPQAALYSQLATAYKAINAPLGPLGRRTLELSTGALLADDATYEAFDNQLKGLTAARDALAARMSAILEAAAFGATPINGAEAQQLIQAAAALVQSVR